jgi:SEFIR domain
LPVSGDMVSEAGVARSQIMISYAHESPAHAARVRQLFELLVAHDLQVVLDQFAAEERQNWSRWTVERIRDAERVLVVVSPAYRRRFERGADANAGRGVQFEGLLISEEIYKDPDTALRKFIPVLLPGATRDHIPTVLLPYSGTSYPVELTEAGVAPLVRLLGGEAGEEVRGAAPRPMTDGRHAALHLVVSSAAADRADDIVRAFLACSPSASAVEFDADTVPSGAIVTGPIEHCADVLSGAATSIHGLTSGAGAPADVRIGAHMADTAASAVAVATRLSLDPAAVGLHRLPRARVAVVVSAGFRDGVAERRSFPPRYSYGPLREDDSSCWVAIAGRSRAPAPRPAAERAGLDEVEDRAAHVVVGVNNGYISGRDMTLNIVKNYGSPR